MFDDWLTTKLQECGHTEQSVASSLGISQQAVSRWCTGETHPRGHRRVQLAELLDVRLGELTANLRTAERPWTRHDIAIRELERRCEELFGRLTRFEQRLAPLSDTGAATQRPGDDVPAILAEDPDTSLVASGERYGVVYAISYDDHDDPSRSGEEVRSPRDAAHYALALTSDAGFGETPWRVFDTLTGTWSSFTQADIERA